jgi:hypothetical protein
MNKNRIGALWIKKKDDREYMTGEIQLDADTLIKVVVFKRDKRSEKEPDWDILKSKEQ